MMLAADSCTTDVSNQVESDRDMVVAIYATMAAYCNSLRDLIDVGCSSEGCVTENSRCVIFDHVSLRWRGMATMRL